MKKSPFNYGNSLKRTIVFADERTKKLVDGGLSVMAEVDRSSLSAAAEKLLLKALLTDRQEVSGPMGRVYSGESTVKGELARVPQQRRRCLFRGRQPAPAASRPLCGGGLAGLRRRLQPR